MNRTSVRQRMTELCRELVSAADAVGRRLCFMEVCGTHTVSACRSGVHALMPDTIRLVSGPGCPVCVTAQRHIDALIKLSQIPGVILTTYGDMLRVIGSDGHSLQKARSEGADVRVVNSTMDAVDLAIANPTRQVVFVSVGFETTAPASAIAVMAARAKGLDNFTIMPAHKLVIPAMLALLHDPDIKIDGFLCPGHVSVIIGSDAYRPVVEQYHKPCVISGFEPLQIMQGVLHLVCQIRDATSLVENLYPIAVTPRGNTNAQKALDRVFMRTATPWRALATIPDSGLELRPEYAAFDALARFNMTLGEDHEPPGCRCGEVITGKCLPHACRLFATVCTPVNPIGPCMVSSEGSCQAWFKYRRHEHRPGSATEVTALAVQTVSIRAESSALH